MPWTTPLTWAVGQLVTAAQMNIHVRDNLQALYDRPMSGVVKIAELNIGVATASPITLAIPGGYKHLEYVANVKETFAGGTAGV